MGRKRILTENHRPICVNLTAEQIEHLRFLGNGNLNAGVRILLNESMNETEATEGNTDG